MATQTRTFQGVTYTNGNCPRSILASLDGDNWGSETAYLRKDAAASWNRARAEVLAETGIVLAVRGWNRSLAEQEQFFHERYVRGLASRDERYHVHNGVGAWYGLKAGNAAAAIPGDSNHGWAIAVDVVDFGNVGNFNHPRRVASIAILKRHGWTDDEGRGSIREPWHLVYDPARDTQKNATPISTGGFMADLTDAEKRRFLAQTADIHAALPKIAELHAGIAPQIPTSTTKDPEYINARAAIRDILIAATRQLDDAVARGVAAALQNVTGVDKEAIAAGVVAEVRKTLDAVGDREYVLTPKENTP